MDGISSNDAAAKGAFVSPSPTEASGSSAAGFGLGSSQRLRKPWQFRRVYDGGNKQVGRHMVLYHLGTSDFLGPSDLLSESDADARRLGVVASKKTGNAPVRARCKRRLRELYRLHQHQLATPHEIVLVARRGLDRAEHPVILAEFLRLATAANLLIPPPTQNPISPSDLKPQA